MEKTLAVMHKTQKQCDGTLEKLHKKTQELYEVKTQLEEEKEQVMAHLSKYKQEREFLFNGEFYRLCPPFKDGNTREYVVSSLSLYFKIPYVDPQKNYIEKNTGRYFSGDELIHAGIAVTPAKGDFTAIRLEFFELND